MQNARTARSASWAGLCLIVAVARPQRADDHQFRLPILPVLGRTGAAAAISNMLPVEQRVPAKKPGNHANSLPRVPVGHLVTAGRLGQNTRLADRK